MACQKLDSYFILFYFNFNLFYFCEPGIVLGNKKLIFLTGFYI